ncbi:GTP-binding protein REM 1-like [Tetranychus urticae]|uniref:Uncharacterized protein n=1 Tax=Tetranychus urticae TaxID=32264 RepID=T1L1U2_TETUR|nr:GTP-binding protein REM 1-like [Tetranychus urticae]
MSADSRRSSSSSTSASQPSTPSTGPSTPTGKSPPSFEGSSFSRYNSSTKRKLNPVRRCQSMKNPNAGNINGTSSITSLTNGISPCNSNNSSFSSIGSTPSFRSRRVSSTPSSLENGRNHTETDFVKYYQYKINRPDTSLPFTIMISNDSQETKTQFNSNGNKHSTNAKTNDTNDANNSTNNEHSKCRVLVLGSTSCGKTSLIRSFEDYIEQTDDSIDRDYAYYRTKYQDENRSNNPTKRSNEIKPALYLHFIEATSLHSCYPQSPLNFYQPDAYIVVYGVNSRESFEGAKKIIDEIFKWDDVDTKPIILVANKTDLVRSRIVSKQEGRQLAMMNNCKYIETSCTISHNVDFLLTGIGAQINLKINSKRCQPNGRKPNIIKRFLNKAVLKKSKSCDNLHVL